jgi:hypothetical protein
MNGVIIALNGVILALNGVIMVILNKYVMDLELFVRNKVVLNAQRNKREAKKLGLHASTE